jgi:hypothetical protein
MRLEVPIIAFFLRNVSEREGAASPSRLAPDYLRGSGTALAHVFDLPFSKLDEDSRYEPAHPRGHVNFFVDTDYLLPVEFAELVVEVDEIQVVAESAIKLIQDQDIPVIEMIDRKLRPDAGAFPDWFTTGYVQVFSLSDYDVLLALAELLS